MRAGMDGPESPEVLEIYRCAKLLEGKLAACVECDDPMEMKIHVDHVVPIARGGKHEAANLQLLSAKENQAKWAHV